MTDFASLGLDARLLDSVRAAGYGAPTPIQAKAIPLALEGRDVLGLAQTGTGKTAAFGLPLVQALLAQPGRPQPKSIKALVLAPTRELVNQIAETMQPYVAGTPIRVGRVVGGQSLNRQVNMLSKGLDLLVATPGRLIDLMDRGAVRLETARFLVLDEADQMLDMGFVHALRKIAPRLGTPRQTMLFSATMPKEMERLAGDYLSDPVRVQVSPPGKAADKVEQCLHYVPQADKPATLARMLAEDPGARTLVFARTKHGAERLMKGLVKDGFDAASIHGNKSQGQRDRAIKAFRDGRTRILVATDVAARGIDIPGVAQVINYELPETAQNYVHRIGRTARAGRSGEAVTLCGPDETGLLRDVEKAMGAEIPVASGERPARSDNAKPARRGRSAGRPGRAGKSRAAGRAPRRREDAAVVEAGSAGERPSKPARGKRGPARSRADGPNAGRSAESKAGPKPRNQRRKDNGSKRTKLGTDGPSRSRRPGRAA